MLAFKGASDPALPPVPASASTPLVWAVWSLAGSPPGSSDWQAVPASGTAQVNIATDGRYIIVARAGDATNNATLGLADGTWALAPLVIDTTPPVMVITSGPAANQTSPRVTVAFADSEQQDEPARVACRWIGPTLPNPPSLLAPDAGATAFGPCIGDGAGANGTSSGQASYSSSMDVTDGYWLFQVKAWDVAGNEGTPASVVFRTDVNPPNISAVTLPPATQLHRLVVSYNVDDGPSGTGVDSVSCRMSAAFVSGNKSDAGTAEYPEPAGIWVTPCPKPAK